MGRVWTRSDSSLTSSSPRKNKRGYRLDRYGKRRQFRRSDDDDFAPRHARERFSKSSRNHSLKRMPRRRRSPDDFENFCRWRADSQSRHHHCLKRRSRRISSNSSESENFRRPRCPASVTPKRKYEKQPDIEVLEKKRSHLKKSRSSSKEILDMNHYYSKSGRLLKEGRLKKAMKSISVCLELCSEEDPFLSKIYSRRGVIFSLLEKPRCSFQGFLDWEHAYIIDKDNIEARKNMSKVFFMAANKLYRTKMYKKAMIPCNHALDLDKKNGEASILLQLLKRKLLEKEIAKTRQVAATNALTAASTSKMRRNPENAMVSISDHNNSVLNEVKRLNSLIENALENENFPRALILVKQALRLYNNDITDDTIFRKLFVLKQNLMDMTP